MVTKKIKVGKHFRRGKKGKLYKVAGHKRRKRALGKTIKYKKIGTFLVAHDELGNFRGSKIRPTEYKKDKTKVRIKRTKQQKIKRKRFSSINNLDKAYFNRKISYANWIKDRKKFMHLG